MSILIPIYYKQGEPATGDLMSWNGRKFVPLNNVYWTQFHWNAEIGNSGAGISANKNYPIGIVYLPSGETATLEGISVRTDQANQTIKVLKRPFGSTTVTPISPASPFSFNTVSTNGSVITVDLPATLSSGDELFIMFGTNAFNAMSVSLNLKHKK